MEDSNFVLFVRRKITVQQVKKGNAHFDRKNFKSDDKTLEKDDIIKKKVYTPKPPLKVEYSLTDLGKTSIPLVKSIADWCDLAVKNQSN